jgi:transcriptional regulator with XRE-family HTH domain
MIMELAKEIGAELRRIRKEQGLTQKQLAERIGYPQATITKVECGRLNTTFKTLQPILQELGLTMKLQPQH